MHSSERAKRFSIDLGLSNVSIEIPTDFVLVVY
jgi:hypothetical protein